jgi:ubiquinone biosynthesis protein Coq4
MSETSYSLPDKLISTMSEQIASLPKDQLGSAYKNWMKPLN